ncbi:hypothetical protein ABIB40_001496 [Pedobacter sp. UYP30]|uniref:hypothetical protein n=1 Tax=Pedobacter sp. UYP30 TaxID=1756400 RepID=UPI003391EAB8
MNKVTTAIKSVNKLGLGAMAIIAIAMMSFKAPSDNFATKKWSFDSSAPAGSQYHDITSLQQSSGTVIRDYRCDDAETSCTKEYDASIDPNVNPMATPLSTVQGTFILEDN